MPHYEVIFETGAHSVMYADSDEEALEGLNEQHRRAVAGEFGGHAGRERNFPAERVKEVLVYDEHPSDFGQDGTVSGEVALAELTGRLKGKKVVSVEELAAEIRQLSSAIDTDAIEESRHNSQFKMKETKKLKGDWS